MGRSFLLSLMLATAARALAAQSTPGQVKVTSCAAADSLLGPMTDEADAVVRLSYSAKSDSTLLLAGPLRTRSYVPAGGEPSAHVLYAIAYAGHGPTAAPLLNLDFMIATHGQDAVGAGGDSVPVTLTVDGSTIPLGSVQISPTALPNGSMEVFDHRLSPNHSFILAGATSAVFTVGHINSTVTARELREIRGMYRLALCGQGPVGVPR